MPCPLSYEIKSIVDFECVGRSPVAALIIISIPEEIRDLSFKKQQQATINSKRKQGTLKHRCLRENMIV
ncbi:MAG: hypothetical protein ISS33_03525 [Candidatus Omnitrophica bacterium]|nr:hypothetical protein [Candidatus Omnitrophota bacterium]